MERATGSTLFVSVLGWSGSGKTTLIVRALAECRRRGISAAAAKRSHHEAAVAPEGKDSTAYLEAGAVAALYVGDRGLALFEPSPELQDRAFYERLLPEAPIVFLEGARVEGSLVVLAAGGASQVAELKLGLDEIDILVTANAQLAAAAWLEGVAVLDRDDILEFIDMIEVRHGT
jgi:molybdopterin-guanine dinucleotide biosynthesis protein MobB